MRLVGMMSFPEAGDVEPRLSQPRIEPLLISREVLLQLLPEHRRHRRIGMPGPASARHAVSRQTQKAEHSVHDRLGTLEQVFAPENEQVRSRKVLEPRSRHIPGAMPEPAAHGASCTRGPHRLRRIPSATRSQSARP